MTFTIVATMVLAAASKFSALAGAWKAVHGFYKYFTRVSEVEKSTKDLLTMNDDLDKMLTSPDRFTADEGKFLDYFLTKAAVLFPYIKRKLVNRLILAISIIISAQIAVPIAQSLTDHDTAVVALQVVVQVMAGFLVSPNLFLDIAEMKFLRNVMALQEMFHDSYVLPPVKTFNALLEYLTEKRFLRNYGQGNWDRISAKFKEASEQPDRFKKEILKRAGLSEGLTKKRLPNVPGTRASTSDGKEYSG